MKRNGFIATSLLYTFFLVFCALVLSFVGLIATNTITLSKQIESINEDLHTHIKIKDVQIGSYFRLNTCSRSNIYSPNETMLYYLINKDPTGVFLSKEVSYKLSNLEFLNEVINKIYVKNGAVSYNSRSMSEADYDIINAYSDITLKEKILNFKEEDISNAEDINYLLANNPTNLFAGSKVYNSKTGLIQKYTDYITANPTVISYIRNAFEIDVNTNIISGE